MKQEIPVSADIIKAYWDEMSSNSSPASMKRKSASLNKFFNWAEAQGHIAKNPMTALSSPQIPVKSTEPVPEPSALPFSAPLKAPVKTWTFVAISLSMVALTFVTVWKLKLPIPFIRNFAAGLADTPDQTVFNPEPLKTQAPKIPSSPTVKPVLTAAPAVNSPPAAANAPTTDLESLLSAIGGLHLKSSNPIIDATGPLLIEANGLILKSRDGGSRDITLNPDGSGVLNLIFEGNSNNQINAIAPNLNSGSLFYGAVANNSKGYYLLDLKSGSNLLSRFNVDSSGNTYAAGNINTTGNIQISGVTRLTSLGRLSSITGYYQDSGLFEINQGAGDFAKISKTLTTASGASSADLMTLSLDESLLSSGSKYKSLVLNRLGGNSEALALFVDNGHVRFDDNFAVNGNSTFGDAAGDSLTFNARVSEGSDLIPITTSGVNDLGSSALPWDNLYAVSIYQNGNLVCDASGANCPAAGSGGSKWKLANGAVSPFSDSLDVLIGSSSTASAKFAFTNVLSGTPTASISGSTSNVATYLTGDGLLSTTNMSPLTIGSATNGVVKIIPGASTTTGLFINDNSAVSGYGTSGLVGLGTSSPQSKLHVDIGGLTLSGLSHSTFGTISNVSQVSAYTLDTTVVPDYSVVGLLGIGQRSGTNGFAGYGVIGVGNGSYVEGVGGRFVSTATDAVPVYGIKTNITSYSGVNGYGVYIGSGAGSGINYGLYQAGSSDSNLFAGATNFNGNVFLGDAITDTITFTGRVAQDADLIPIGTTGTNTLGTSTLPWDNLYSGNIGITSTDGYIGYPDSQYQAYTPYDSSFNSFINSTVGVYINLDSDNNESDTTIFAVGKNKITSSTTGELFRINESGTVGINTSGPDRRLDILDASNAQLRLTYADGATYTDFQTDSAGDLTITPSGGDVNLAGNLTLTGTNLLTTGARSSPNSYSIYVNGSTYYAVSNYGGTNYSNSNMASLVESVVADLNTLGGGSIIFQRGTFDMGTSNFTCNGQNNIKITGQGIDATTIQNSSDAASDTEPLSFTNCKRWTISDLTVSAGGTSRSSSDAIDVDGGDEFLIERVKITDSRSRGIVFDGKDTTGTGTADRNIIRDNIITGSSIDGDGIELLASSRNLVTGNKIYDVTGHGIQLNKASATAAQPNKQSQYNTVSGNDIYNVGQDGINLNSASNNTLTGNNVLNSANITASRDGIRIQASDSIACSFNIVNGNTVTDDQGTDTQRYGVNISDSLCAYNTISNNYIEGNLTADLSDTGTQTQYSQYRAGTNYIAKTIVTDTDGTTDFLGIGNTTPTARLDIADIVATTGNIIYATASAITSGNFIKLGSGGNSGNFSGNGIFMDFDNTGGNSFTGNFLKLSNAGTVNYTLDSAGNASSSGNITLTGTAPAIATTGLKNLIIGDANTGGLILNGSLPAPGGTLGDICISGRNVVLADGTSCSTSSERFKNTIKNIDLGLSEVMKMRPVSFYYNDDTDKNNPYVGFIAEEVEKIDTRLVDYDRGGLPSNVRYETYTAVLTRAIQEQQKQIADLTSKVTENITVNTAAGAKVISEYTKNLVSETVKATQIESEKILVRLNLSSPELKTAVISPMDEKADIEIRIGSVLKPSAELVIKNAELQKVASIDTRGNATFSGTVKSETSITETLVAGEVKSKSLDEIKSLLTQVESDQHLMKAAVEWNTATATTSAARKENLSAGELFITGQAAINSLFIAKGVSMGSDFHITSGTSGGSSFINSIDTIKSPLKIQSQAASPIEFMAGLITIDTLGNMHLKGNLNVAGTIKGGGLALEAGDKTGNILSIIDASENTLAGVDASGSASFSSLSTQNLIIAGANENLNSELIDGVINANSPVGKASIPSGVKEVLIKNPKVTDYSLIYVTPTSDTENRVLYVKSKKSGEFSVGFSEAIAKETQFNWWIVQIQN